MLPARNMMSLQDDINNYYYLQTLKKRPNTKKKNVSTVTLSRTATKPTISQPKMVSAPQTAKKSNHIENKESLLLTKVENELIIKLLGERCQTLATAVIQLFLTSHPDHSSWIKRESGVLCFIKDNVKRAYFFRIYCPIRKRLVWQQELYNNIEYKSPTPYLHTFEAEDGMAAFNFANEDEAQDYRSIVLEKIASRQRKEKRMRNSIQSQRTGTSANMQQSRSTTTLGPSSTWGGVPNVSNGSSLHPHTNYSNGSPVVPQHQRSNSAGGQLKTVDKISLSKKRTRNLTTRDISAPSDFKHVSHVGWDATKGFEIDTSDENLKKFFDEAGVSEKQLQDKDTAQFIYDFLEMNGGMEAVKEDMQKKQTPRSSLNFTDVTSPPGIAQPPPVPARILPQQRTAPPPPTRVSRAVPSIPSKPPPPVVSTAIPPNVPPPPPPLPSTSVAPPPPPPPPPPAPIGEIITNQVTTTTTSSAMSSSQLPDTRSALLESIRSGAKLKHVDVERTKPPVTNSGDSRNDLLSEIRQGVELKAVTVNAQKPAASNAESRLAGALARALAERSRAIHSDSDTSDTTSDEEEWED